MPPIIICRVTLETPPKKDNSTSSSFQQLQVAYSIFKQLSAALNSSQQPFAVLSCFKRLYAAASSSFEQL
eukprot:2146581-Alexandrium_andersonii.AAC.1